MRDDNNIFIYKDEKLLTKRVEVLDRDNDFVTITSGIEEGETITATPPFSYVPGMKAMIASLDGVPVGGPRGGAPGGRPGGGTRTAGAAPSGGAETAAAAETPAAEQGNGDRPALTPEQRAARANMTPEQGNSAPSATAGPTPATRWAQRQVSPTWRSSVVRGWWTTPAIPAPICRRP